MLANISTTSNFRRSFNPHVHLVKSRRELCKRHIFQYKNIIIDFFCKSEPTSRCLHPSLRLKVNLFSEMVTPFFLCAKITWLGIVSPLGISSDRSSNEFKRTMKRFLPRQLILNRLIAGKETLLDPSPRLNDNRIPPRLQRIDRSFESLLTQRILNLSVYRQSIELLDWTLIRGWNRPFLTQILNVQFITIRLKKKK